MVTTEVRARLSSESVRASTSLIHIDDAFLHGDDGRLLLGPLPNLKIPVKFDCLVLLTVLYTFIKRGC